MLFYAYLVCLSVGTALATGALVLEMHKPLPAASLGQFLQEVTELGSLRGCRESYELPL